MVAIKALAAIAEKYTRRASAAQTDYQGAIQATPEQVWEAGASAGANNWAAGVAAAAADGRFAAGVSGKGSKWKRKATTVGPSRYATGVAAAAPDFSAGFQRFYDMLASLTLGPRGPRGDQRNYDRSKAVGTTLNQGRLAMKKGG